MRRDAAHMHGTEGGVKRREEPASFGRRQQAHLAYLRVLPDGVRLRQLPGQFGEAAFAFLARSDDQFTDDAIADLRFASSGQVLHEGSVVAGRRLEETPPLVRGLAEPGVGDDAGSCCGGLALVTSVDESHTHAVSRKPVRGAGPCHTAADHYHPVRHQNIMAAACRPSTHLAGVRVVGFLSLRRGRT